MTISDAATFGAHPVLPPEYEPAVTLLVQAIVAKNGVPAPIDQAEATIELMRQGIEQLWPDAASDSVYDVITGEVMKRISVAIDPPIVLAPNFEPWFTDAVISGEIKLERWYSYKQFLTTDKGFAPQVLDELDRASNEIVDLLGDPTVQGSWKRRGLVIGDVQSGKTATYIGIVNKAADAGFKLVVLLTGGTESLRKQTQYRVDEGFLGKDSSVVHDKVIGVGRFPTQSKFLRGQGMTTYAKDFVGGALQGQAVNIDPNADHPYVFVIKKNKTALTNLIAWLSAQFNDERFDIPMLVVDDESDYASVNTNYKADGDANPTAINKLIRELLRLATRSSYMAFTATPFANVFIDHTSWNEAIEDDLFPHHYIFALSSPSNYGGVEKYFGSADAKSSEHLVDIVDAHEVFPSKHKSQLRVDTLPESLSDAIRAFIVGSAVRIARGDHSARSMLVNVSRFKNVQSQVHDLVQEEFTRIKLAIEIHARPGGTSGDGHEVIAKLSDTYALQFPEVQLAWDDVRDKLFEAVFGTSVELVNSSRDKSSDDKARNLIAVGGDVLSRGLTLDGLMVSYFYRIVGAADTLLQMARWFGYRPGYDDLVRVWISPDAADQFRFVADVTAELRLQIAEMRDSEKTPEDFGLMVRKHPETLAITAKRGVAETHPMEISLAGRRIETIRVPAVASTLASNDTAVREFLAAIDEDDRATGWEQPGIKFKCKLNVSKGRIADLLERFKYDRGNLILANALHRIIREQTGPAFENWTVGVVTGEGSALTLGPTLLLEATPARAVQFSPDGGQGTFRVSGRSARLAGSTDLAQMYLHDGPDLREPEVCAHLPHPTLLIYPLRPLFDPKKSRHSSSSDAAAQAGADQAKAAWSAVGGDDLGVLMALKVAIPGKPGGKGGDVVYLLNGPAIEAYRELYLVDADDADDVDD